MANFSFNKVILGGRLTSDVELKATQSGVPVAQFSIAINRKFSKDGQQETDFINCTAWRQTAEFISKYFRKGSSICVVGSMQVRSWVDQSGQKRYATDVVVDEAMFVDSQGAGTPTATNYIPDTYKTPTTPNFESVAVDDGLPF